MKGLVKIFHVNKSMCLYPDIQFGYDNEDRNEETPGSANTSL